LPSLPNVLARPVGEGPDRVQVGEVDAAHLKARRRMGAGDLRGGPAAPGLVAHGQEHVRAVAGELPGGDQAEAAAGPGDDEGPAGQVGDAVRGPRGLRHTSQNAAVNRLPARFYSVAY
jgi:hypothetical protein